ncbi:hypothetical protein EK904_011709 [Melospiza melodia maxima]|nr:hypothetical protein EK904_011709 [Melospiza melodia maxima]
MYMKKKSSHGPKKELQWYLVVLEDYSDGSVIYGNVKNDPARILNINSSSSSNSFSKTQKLTKEHKEKNSKDSKEQKSAFKEPSREHNKSSKESSKKPKENKPLRDEKMVPKMAFKEPKPMSKEPKSENTPILTITCGQQQEKKTLTKRPSMLDTDESSARKRKKPSSDSLFKSFPSAPPLILTCSADKKQTKEKSQLKVARVKVETDALERKTPTLPPFDDIVDPSDSDMEENVSSKSDSEQPSPASSSSSSSSSFTPSQNNRQQGPLRTIMKDLHSDDNEDESDEADDKDNDSELEQPVNTRGGGGRSRRVSLSDGSDSDSSSASSPLRHDPAPPVLKTSNSQILEVKSPIKQNKTDKQMKNGDCDKAVGTAPVKAVFMARLCRLGQGFSSSGNTMMLATEVYQEWVEEPNYLPIRLSALVDGDVKMPKKQGEKVQNFDSFLFPFPLFLVFTIMSCSVMEADREQSNSEVEQDL